ncbi:hypothetical protein C8J57DRAFT_1484379 [Mycena rebaudengoi]|nr:hypothetical protein C8J57DRAFT_1484379 [Mycena rebaudengoi]
MRAARLSEVRDERDGGGTHYTLSALPFAPACSRTATSSGARPRPAAHEGRAAALIRARQRNYRSSVTSSSPGTSVSNCQLTAALMLHPPPNEPLPHLGRRTHARARPVRLQHSAVLAYLTDCAPADLGDPAFCVLHLPPTTHCSRLTCVAYIVDHMPCARVLVLVGRTAPDEGVVRVIPAEQGVVSESSRGGLNGCSCSRAASIRVRPKLLVAVQNACLACLFDRAPVGHLSDTNICRSEVTYLAKVCG